MFIDDEGRRVWDISQALRPGIPTWPGDVAYEERTTWEMSDDCPVNVGRLAMSTHTGTHADAPRHYARDGGPIGAVPVTMYIGPAQLISAIDHDGLIGVDHVEARLKPGVKRVLLRTFAAFPVDRWRSDFAATSHELIEWLAARGVTLIGVDAPSLDPETARDMRAHAAVARNGMAILEGLLLDGVPDGLYELVALPLRIANADASPVRAILRERPRAPE